MDYGPRRLQPIEYGPCQIRPMLNAAHILLQNPRTDVGNRYLSVFRVDLLVLVINEIMYNVYIII